MQLRIPLCTRALQRLHALLYHPHSPAPVREHFTSRPEEGQDLADVESLVEPRLSELRKLNDVFPLSRERLLLYLSNRTNQIVQNVQYIIGAALGECYSRIRGKGLMAKKLTSLYVSLHDTLHSRNLQCVAWQKRVPAKTLLHLPSLTPQQPCYFLFFL